MSQRGLRFSPEHSRDLFMPGLACHLSEPRMRPPTRYFFGHNKLRRRSGGHLRQMRNTEYLMIASELSHFGADGICNLPTNVCVDLIKDEQWNGVLLGQRRFDRE